MPGTRLDPRDPSGGTPQQFTPDTVPDLTSLLWERIALGDCADVPSGSARKCRQAGRDAFRRQNGDL